MFVVHYCPLGEGEGLTKGREVDAILAADVNRKYYMELILSRRYSDANETIQSMPRNRCIIRGKGDGRKEHKTLVNPKHIYLVEW